MSTNDSLSLGELEAHLAHLDDDLSTLRGLCARAEAGAPDVTVADLEAAYQRLARQNGSLAEFKLEVQSASDVAKKMRVSSRTLGEIEAGKVHPMVRKELRGRKKLIDALKAGGGKAAADIARAEAIQEQDIDATRRIQRTIQGADAQAAETLSTIDAQNQQLDRVVGIMGRMDGVTDQADLEVKEYKRGFIEGLLRGRPEPAQGYSGGAGARGHSAEVAGAGGAAGGGKGLVAAEEEAGPARAAVSQRAQLTAGGGAAAAESVGRARQPQPIGSGAGDAFSQIRQNDEEINENLDAIEQGVKGLHRKAEAIGAGLAESAVKIELAQEKTVEQTDKLKRTNRNLERAIARKESGCCGCGGPPSRFVD